jgi:hypothetical protein
MSISNEHAELTDIKGLIEGAAPPAQTDNQNQKIKAIHAEVDHAKIALEDTAMELQERGEIMDDLQRKTGQSLSSSCSLSPVSSDQVMRWS